MGLKYRKSVKIAPGVRLNISNKSTSISIGGKGFRKTYSSTGKTTTTVGIPGTGLSYVETIEESRKDGVNMSAKKDKASSGAKAKKPIYKKWWFWIIIVILLGAGSSSDGGDTKDDIQEETEQITEAEQATQNNQLSNEEPTVEAPAVTPAPETDTAKPETPNAEVDPEAAFREMLNQYNYVGSAESDKYHKPKCRWTKEITDQNLVHFDSKEEAEAAGYIACGTCNP